MNIKHIFCLLMLQLYGKASWSQQESKSQNRIIIIEGPIKIKEDSIKLSIYPFRYERFSPWIIKGVKQPIKGGYIRWEVTTKVPVNIMNGLFSSNMAYLAEPGDSIHIDHKDDEINFSGKGSEKFRLGKMVENFINKIKGSPEDGLSDGDREPASSLQDYLRWNNYLSRKTREWNLLLDNNKKNISELAYLDLKDRALRHIEKIRMHKFHSIRRSSIIGPVNQFGLTNEDLCKIYDTTMVNPSSHWLRYGRDYIFPTDYPWDMLHDEDYRRRGKFFRTNESDTLILGNEADQFVSIYNMIKEKYTGIARENMLAYTFYSPSGALREGGFVPKIESILADYYTQPGYPEFKKQVREYELERRVKWNQINAPNFILTNMEGKQFGSEQLKGKIVVMDFWFTGCAGCVQMAPALRKVEEHFAKDSNIIFLSISIDKNKDVWQKSIAQKKYTSGGGTQLYTGGEGGKHEIIKKLLVESYPTLEIIDPNGLFIKLQKEKIDPRRDDGKAIIALLEKHLASLNDGPYVFHEGDISTAYFIYNDQLSKQSISKTETLQVQTDGPKKFPVALKPSLQTEASEYDKPEKLFVLSDIEGNFDQFRKLLQTNNIIDANYNWLFGKGHLVFGGDMFDRGLQVTECLWLIYSLEEKAKASGGYVHFVLGNHEIMNLQGEHSYVMSKYKANVALMNKTLTQLYSENSELGRWLRTKNIVERIGDILFTHGGISRKLNQLAVTVDEINQLSRPNYSISRPKYEYGAEKTNVIMNSKTSPFWYRSYYDDKREMPQIIDSTLQKFDVKHIVTGHTIVADTISVHYGGKVINTDTHHAEGKSEALLIEGDRFYRVSAEGKKVLLFTDNKRKTSGK